LLNKLQFKKTTATTKKKKQKTSKKQQTMNGSLTVYQLKTILKCQELTGTGKV
jgi:hypothetical protein